MCLLSFMIAIWVNMKYIDLYLKYMIRVFQWMYMSIIWIAIIIDDIIKIMIFYLSIV